MLTREQVIELIDSAKTAKDRATLEEYFSTIEGRYDPRKQTIVFSSPSASGTNYFRLNIPMWAMYKATDDFNLIFTYKISPIHLAICDLLIMHRAGDIHDLMHSILKAYPTEKIKPFIIHNVDDNEINLSRSHNLRDMWLASGRDKQSSRSISESDVVETTTRKLKQVFSNYNKNVIIEPNVFNWNLKQWNLEKKQPLSKYFTTSEINNLKHFELPENFTSKDSCVINWTGLTSHFEDLKKIAPILLQIHNKYPNTCFAICGMALKDTSYRIEKDPKTGKENFIEEENVPVEQTYRYRVSKLFKDFDQSRVKIYDALELEQYAWFYSIADIGIVLVEHNTFNASKSSIKFIENIAYNNFTVCSDFGGYNDTFELLRGNPSLNQELIAAMACKSESNISEWSKKLSYFVENKDSESLKNDLENIKTFLKDYYDVNKNIEERISKYKLYIENNIEKQKDQQLLLEQAFQQ